MHDALTLLRALLEDPTVTGVGRLPMRTPFVSCPDVDTARTHRAADSPWWRSLDGTWELRTVSSPSAVFDPASGPDEWFPVEVPGAWSTQRRPDGSRVVAPHYTNVVMPFDGEPPHVPDSTTIGVYRRRVVVPRAWAGRRVVLRIGAAESGVVVLVDGRVVGAGTDSRLPSEFDLTGHVRAGRGVDLQLVVPRWSASSWIEDQDQWWHGGLQRSVTLHSTAPSHLADVRAVPGLVSADDGHVGRLELTVTADGPLRREPGWTVEATVETLPSVAGRAGRTLAGTGRLPVPTWDDSSEAAQLIGGMFVEPGVLRHRLDVAGIEPWSHEAPRRYRLMVTLRDPAGDVVEVTAMRTGFRSLEIGDNELRINGRAVLLHGVNLHEHDPDRGRAVSEQLTRTDLLSMKANNLNAVRAAHYPHDEHLAELCDELGLYLVDEANVESHARQASLCHDPRYTAAIVDRVARMVARDANHPSIVMWSLGNEAGDGAAHAAAAAWVRREEPSRPLHYEGPLMHDLYAEAPVTDVVCPMYASIDDIVAWARSGRDERRPLILCEYSHAMGNSNGSLADYWAAIDAEHGLQGGFIWEWLDHGLERDDAGSGPGGRTSWGYGGDFGDRPHDANFVCDGLVSPQRVPHAAMAEVHWVGRPATVAWADAARRRLEVRNRRWFSDLDDLVARWSLIVDGEPIERGELELPTLGPRDTATVALPGPARTPRVPCGAEAHLAVTWQQRRATPWAPAGHVVSSDQLTLPTRSARAPRGRAVPIPRGAWPIEQVDWSPTLFRALTDNDGLRQSWMRGLIGHVARWVDTQGLDRAEWRPGDVTTRTRAGVPEHSANGELVTAGGTVAVRRRVQLHGDGWTRVQIDLQVPPELADPPRVGTEWALPGALDVVQWFGDGPHECYPDRRSSATVGRWRATVDELYEDLVLPQEHGHRTGVRWLVLRPARARRDLPGLLVVADPGVGDGTFGMSVRRHRDADLWASRHTDDLAREDGQRPTATYLYLDVAQRGLGTGSCGPDALERYRIPSGRHRLAFWCAAVGARDDVAGLARSVRAPG